VKFGHLLFKAGNGGIIKIRFAKIGCHFRRPGPVGHDIDTQLLHNLHDFSARCNFHPQRRAEFPVDKRTADGRHPTALGFGVLSVGLERFIQRIQKQCILILHKRCLRHGERIARITNRAGNPYIVEEQVGVPVVVGVLVHAKIHLPFFVADQGVPESGGNLAGSFSNKFAVAIAYHRIAVPGHRQVTEGFRADIHLGRQKPLPAQNDRQCVRLGGSQQMSRKFTGASNKSDDVGILIVAVGVRTSADRRDSLGK